MAHDPTDFQEKRNRECDFPLQITSLADVLIIVLVFLLNAFSTGIRGVADVNVPAGIKLPEASTSGSADRGLVVEISGAAIKLDSGVAASLTNFRFDASDLRNDLPKSSTSTALTGAFAKQKGRFPASAPIWIVADKRAPYATIQTVLASAAVNGYSNVKLAVVTNK